MKLPQRVMEAWKCRSGATAVEFALVFLPLLLFTVGAVEFGRAFFVQNGLAYAADAAARDVMIGKVDPAATDTEAEAILRPTALNAFDPGNPDLMQLDAAMVTVDGVRYRVLTVSYPFNVVTPGLFDGPVSLTTTRRVPAGEP